MNLDVHIKKIIWLLKCFIYLSNFIFQAQLNGSGWLCLIPISGQSLAAALTARLW